MILRLTDKLRTKIKAEPLAWHPLHENPLADWSARLITVDRVQYILACNTPSRFALLMHGRGINSRAALISALLQRMRDTLALHSLAPAFDRLIAPAATSVSFSKALNRSITGSMNELESMATDLLRNDSRSLDEVGLRLHTFLLGGLTGVAGRYGYPGTVIRRLIDQAWAAADAAARSGSCP